MRKIWQELPTDYAEKLVESMPKRCQAILDNGGDWTIFQAVAPQFFESTFILKKNVLKSLIVFEKSRTRSC